MFRTTQQRLFIKLATHIYLPSVQKNVLEWNSTKVMNKFHFECILWQFLPLRNVYPAHTWPCLFELRNMWQQYRKVGRGHWILKFLEKKSIFQWKYYIGVWKSSLKISPEVLHRGMKVLKYLRKLSHFRKFQFGIIFTTL